MRCALLLPLLVLAACGPSMQAGNSSDVTLTVEPQTVAPAGSITLTLRNASESEVGYNLCSSGLEQNVGGTWTAVPSDRVCTMELRLLPPGEETTYPLELPISVEPGEYRFVTNVDMAAVEDFGPVRSDPFEVAQ